ncbi:MAG: acyltransferase [Bacteroidales bacterium]|nr:acyltransferase [Bacteroidales bacterium]MDD3859691.1 acyltransferase [Bacteroidales bacterium]
MNLANYRAEIFNKISNEKFEELAIFAFKYQFKNNCIYREYCDYLNVNPNKIKKIEDIPFLPISFFRTQKVVSGDYDQYTIFRSSATTGANSSKHYVADTNLYENSFVEAFKYFYDNPENYVILALLPSYIERKDSSLVYMVNGFLKREKAKGGFYLNDFENLYNEIIKLEEEKNKYILLGVSFALYDFAMKYNLNCNCGIIMETGGMKGRRKELTRVELHNILCKSFGVSEIHSEFGMTELLSQAYSKVDGLYNCPPWMRVFVRETSDPLTISNCGSGALNIIDLANINSCCFIETSDLGTVYSNGSFTVTGRFDIAEVRGCNLMAI